MTAVRRPKLGQHFLTSEGYRHRIAASLPITLNDLVIEIGPGRGAMTGLLAERAGHVVAVELDAALAGELREKYKGQKRIEIVEGDILATGIAGICRESRAESCFLFGNLPYYITSPIIHHLMDAVGIIHGMALLVQREVAERIIARPGSRDYGYLSVLVQLHSEPCITMGVPPGAFSPPPKVHSAVVEFIMSPKFPKWKAPERAGFQEFVQLCFAKKRKNLMNNLGQNFGRESVRVALEAMHLPLTARAEELTIEQFAALRIELKK